MQIVCPSFEILTPLDPPAMMVRLEKAGRTCYRSEKNITPDSAATFVKSIIKSGHLSVIEHENISLKLICDRGVTHELVRHRLASYSQESTRYVNYSRGPDGPGLVLIKPLFFPENSEKYRLWLMAMEGAEKNYLDLIAAGASPQEARTVLPNSLKAEIVMTTNLRQWRHILALRTASASHPQIREIMNLILTEFKILMPEIFGDL